MLKLHAWIYRTFGIYTKYSRKKEQEYVKSLGEVSEFEYGLTIGTWQMKHGFYRTSKQLKKRIKRWNK